MISNEDIRAFTPEDYKDIVVTKSGSGLGKEIFRYEVTSHNDIPESSLVMRRLEKYPGNFYMTISDDITGEKLSVLVPQHVFDAMIKASGSA